ncbi:two-component system sensor histidine kinase/response regulator fusion protein [Malaciobacter molluscorum LMG 25693]|nr:two-component system sensor histidine kinase/response regulator fusion protein [Malaciobacter molluscorum LMG 25693]
MDDEKDINKILLVDDNPKNLQIAMNILKDFNVIYSTSGENALTLVEENNFDLILLDIVMPNMSGYEVCEKLKQNNRTKDIPIIFLTVKHEEKDIIEGLEKGAVDYLIKPFYPQVLLKRVQLHLKLASSLKELKQMNEHLNEIIDKKIKEITKKENIIVRQSKFATMGEMIGNIAHQWRQPLSTITTASSGILLKMDFDTLTNEDIVSSMNMINSSAKYLSQTIDDFKSFYDPKRNKFKSIYIDDVIEKSLKLVKAQFSAKDIHLVKNLENIKITSLENELIQVLINILNNARDEVIKLKTKRLIFINSYKENEFLNIEIIDNAGGIEEKLHKKIFDAYFTTKEEKGTGIGLYMSKEIMQKLLDGDIKVENCSYEYESEKFEGAKFILKLPLIF